MRNFGSIACRGFAIATAVLISTAVRAADSKVEELLSNMRNSYRLTKSATYTTESHFGSNTFVSTFSFVGPSKIRVDTISPNSKSMKTALIEITDGKTMNIKPPNTIDFVENPFTVDRFAQSLPVDLESLSFFDWDRQLSTAEGKNMSKSTFKIELNVEWNAKKWTVLEETAAAQKVVCRYFIDPHTFFIWRTLVTAMPGGSANDNNDCRITKLNLSPKIDESIFTIVHV